jgi:hypothetical protein
MEHPSITAYNRLSRNVLLCVSIIETLQHQSYPWQHTHACSRSHMDISIRTCALRGTFPENRRWNEDKGKGAGWRWAQIDASAVKRLGRRNPVGGVEGSGAETQIKFEYRKYNSVFNTQYTQMNWAFSCALQANTKHNLSERIFTSWDPKGHI